MNFPTTEIARSIRRNTRFKNTFRLVASTNLYNIHESPNSEIELEVSERNRARIAETREYSIQSSPPHLSLSVRTIFVTA